jgi:predicted amidohydrolase YtcJ
VLHTREALFLCYNKRKKQGDIMKTAYINAKLLHPRHNAFIVEKDQFTHVGSKQHILNQPIDKIIDLNDHAVLPGFHDSHMHMLGIGKIMSWMDLSQYKTTSALIKDAKNHPQDIILGRGFHESQFASKDTLTKSTLNQISTTKPVIFYRVCGHMIVVNDYAIDKAKAQNALPSDHHSYDLETGVFKEDAIHFITHILPKPTQEELKDAILNAQTYLLSQGITSIGSDDFSMYDVEFETILEAFKSLDESNQLKINVLEQANIPNLDNFQRFIDKGYVNKTYNRYTLGPLKLLADGSLGARSAYMSTPYNDSDQTGIKVFDDDTFTAFITKANNNNMDVAIHAIGDQMIEDIINTIEAIPEEHRKDRRHSIIHAQLARPDQIERMAKLNIGAQTQPIFLNSDIVILDDALGARKNETYLFKTMADKGVVTTISTDAPVEPVNPFYNLYCAITRRSIKYKTAEPHLENEGFSLESAIAAYTTVPAYFAYKENTVGAIKKGQKADFIILSGIDYNNPDSLLTTSVLETYINGESVYKE